MPHAHRHEVTGWKARTLALAGRSRKAGLVLEWAWWTRAVVRARFLRRRAPWYAPRLDTATPFPSHLTPLLDELPAGPIRVIDVGSGPFSVLGAGHATRTLTIVATDPLARPYNAVLWLLRLRPAVPTRAIAGEDLSRAFGPAAFDFAHARNSLDHAEDPVAIVLAMVAVTKPGGIIFLQHHPDEAEDRGGTGLHRWNLSEDGGRFVIWDEHRRVDVTDLLRGEAEVAVVRTPVWVEVTMRKRTNGAP
ncbi:MAG: class I SAM-dependent methyltransferase [Dehalococcoidia bacterium]